MATDRAKALTLEWMWLATLIPPVLYGGMAMAATYRADPATGADDLVGDRWIVVLMAAKGLTLPSLLVLLALLARRLATDRRRPLVAAGVWTATGGTLAVAVGRFTPSPGRSSPISLVQRVWPTQSSPVSDGLLRDVGAFGPRWTVPGMQVREIAVMAATSLVTAFAMRACVRRQPEAAWVAGPIVVMAALIAYAYLTPWALSEGSHEYVLGDVLLGGTLAELAVPIVPVDFVGAAALGVAALSMGGLLVLWRNPPPPPTPARRPATALASSDTPLLPQQEAP